MVDATVKTVQFLDTRIEPQPDPVYDYVIAPTQNQYYQIPASGISNSAITFNNLTTLGADRAYLDTFEIELKAEIDFVSNKAPGTLAQDAPFPSPAMWTFDSFPFSKCCDEIRVNINGGAFFSQPSSYLRAKERYMKQYALANCYENVCPVHRPECQTESGAKYNQTFNVTSTDAETNPYCRTGIAHYSTQETYFVNNTQQGGFNNEIIKLGPPNTEAGKHGYTNYYVYYDSGVKHTKVTVTWREPVCCSPFSSRYDATYGRPLYNVTSMDLAFTMTTLQPMIRIVQGISPISADSATEATAAEFVKSYSITLSSARLCYQVMTIPTSMTKPLMTLVPYRRFVPYVTEYPGVGFNSGSSPNSVRPIDGDEVEIQSGVYTLNEIPTASWMFIAPSKSILQTWPQDTYSAQTGNKSWTAGDFSWDGDGGANTGQEDVANSSVAGNWDSNRLFAYIKHVDLSLANTTQILNTASPEDLYRIAKANGCQDSFVSWGSDDTCSLGRFSTDAGRVTVLGKTSMATKFDGAGSVLRLKPGVDIVVPDQPLIPGANAYNMVFQARVKAQIPPHSKQQDRYSLWLLFEYVGVASISPGQCEITMNPLGSGEIMAVSPIMSSTSSATEGELSVMGADDMNKRLASLGDQGFLNSRTSAMIKKAVSDSTAAAQSANGEGVAGMGRVAKRPRGGAIMGKGYADWI